MHACFRGTPNGNPNDSAARHLRFDEQIIRRNTFSRLYMYGRDYTITVSRDMRRHRHRFECHQRAASGHALPELNRHFYHRARHRRGDIQRIFRIGHSAAFAHHRCLRGAALLDIGRARMAI